MKKVILLIVILFSISLTSELPAQLGYSTKIDSILALITSQSMTILDRQLSGDTSTVIGGVPYTIVTRHYSTEGNIKAAQYIYEKFQSFGLTAKYMNNSATNINVYAKKTGTKYPNQYFVICSHYDDMPSGTLAPGADDNASGTCAVIEAARLLSNYNLDYSVVFAAFDEEERGLYGSKAFADSAYFRGDSIVGVFNFDMIAWDGNNDYKYYVTTNTASMQLADDFIACSRVYVPSLVPVKNISTTANSDHASFWTRSYKAVMSIEDNNDFNLYYHTINDKFLNVKVDYFVKMTKAGIAALVASADDYKINFVHTPVPTNNQTTPRTAAVTINSNKKIAKGVNAPRLYYRVNSGAYSFLNPVYNNIDTFKFTIPGAPLHSYVSYYFAAQDSLAEFVCTYPAGGKGINPPGTIAPLDSFSYQVENIVIAYIGNGTASSNYPYTTYYMDGRTDMLYTASEIIASGGIQGYITNIGFNVITADPAPMNGFNVKMQTTSATSLSSFTSSGWSINFSGTYTVPGTGWKYINLSTPFYWNGTSNILIEICYDNSSYTQYSPVYATAVPNMAYGKYQDLSSGGGCVDITTGAVLSNRPNISIYFALIDGLGNPVSGIPDKFSLSQNYPNPFNPVTRINYSVAKQSFVSIKIYDVLGKEVTTLVNESKQPGNFIVEFNASEFSSGIYFYKMTAGKFIETRKMIINK